MRNFTDSFSDDDKATVRRWTDERLHPAHKQDIPMPLFVCAQLGYYYGWQAVVDYRRGYHIGYNSKGNIERLAFSLEDAIGLIKAAEKVCYRIKLDEGKINAATNVSSRDKKYAEKNRQYINDLQRRTYQ